MYSTNALLKEGPVDVQHVFLIGSKLLHPFDHPLITAFLSLYNVRLVLFCWALYHVLETFLLTVSVPIFCTGKGDRNCVAATCREN